MSLGLAVRHGVRVLDRRLSGLLVNPLRWPRGRGRAAGPIDLPSATGILVVRLDEIGDVVLTTGFLRELRRAAPRTRITLVVKPGVVNLVERCPYVDDVHGFEPAGRRVNASIAAVLRARRFARHRLRPAAFDVALVPRWDVDTQPAALLAALSGAASRVGFAETTSRAKARVNRGRDDFFTHVLDDRRIRHEALRGLDLLRFVGARVEADALEVWTDACDETAADELLAGLSAWPGRPLVGLGVGAGHPRRRWPAARYRTVADHLVRSGHAVVVVGGPEDREAGEEVARVSRDAVLNAAGRTTLREVAALLARCVLYVGNDAGPMHLAAAAGVAVVAVSCHARDASPDAASSPERFGPWRVPSAVCRPTRLTEPCANECTAARAHCIAAVTTTEVLDAVRLALEAGALS